MMRVPARDRDRRARPGVRPGRAAGGSESDRRHHLLDASATVFLERGYSTATMDAIALAAGMSKKTLYQLYPSKLALFDALLLDRLFALAIPTDLGGDTQEERLVRLLLTMADLLLQPDRVALCRLIVAEGQENGALLSAFERLDVVRDMSALELWIAAEIGAGRLRDADVHDTARLLFGITLAEPMLGALMRVPDREGSRLTLEHRVRHGVALFLVGQSSA